MNQSLTQQRIRITFGQDGPMRYVGHHDLAQTWERILRRAQAPLEYSQGFNPRPHVQFAAALPVGVSSEDEHLDVWLTERLDDLDAWRERIRATSPAGITARRIEDVPVRSPALPTLVTHADYAITPADPQIEPAELHARAQALLAQDAIHRVRHNGKRYDLRPLILDLSAGDDGQLAATLAMGSAGTGRADELVDALGYELGQLRVHRCRLALRPADA